MFHRTYDARGNYERVYILDVDTWVDRFAFIFHLHGATGSLPVMGEYLSYTIEALA